jgi:hypothetical protein
MHYMTFDQARKEQKANPASRWHKPSSAGALDVTTASYRYSERFFRPALAEPKFRLHKDENFFMIGSCFARGLEAALANRKFNVLSQTSAFDQWNTYVAGTTPLGATNKYNLGSIRNEFVWALGIDRYPEEALAHLGNGLVYDPHMNPVFGPALKEEVQARRKVMTDLVGKVREADVVVVTLGLVEVWKDTHLDLITNSTPNPLACRTQPDLGYKENLQFLEDIYELLSKNTRAGSRIIVTVSPVPLEATFTRRDIIEATTYSKSLLRVVAEDFALSKPNVEYFPSYEIVMNSPRPNAWMEDCRHVRGELANFIMTQFINHFVLGTVVNEGEQLLTADYVG